MQRSISPPSTRELKVTSSHYTSQRWPRPPAVPFIRLKGYWLEKAGFSVGKLVKVEVADNCIKIVTTEP
jgi:toxic protein SymE